MTSVDSPTTRADLLGTNWFVVATYLARERVGDSGHSSGPDAAGGTL